MASFTGSPPVGVNPKLLYAIFKYQHECKNSEKKAYQHLKQIYFEHSASQSMLVSVIKYLLSYSEDINKNYYEEIRLLEQAAHTFVMNGYISRSLFCFNDLSLAYSNVFDYEKSVNAAEKAMRIAGQINNLEMLNGMYNNLSIIYHQMEDYEKAKEYATIVKDIPLFSLSAYSILVVANMRFGDIQEAKSAMEVLEKMNQKENSEHYGHFIRVNKAKLYNKKGPHYYSALKAYLHYAKDNLPISRSIRIYEDMIDYCRENSMYDELIAYHEKINECYKLIKK